MENFYVYTHKNNRNQNYIWQDTYNTNFGCFLEESLICKYLVNYLLLGSERGENSKEAWRRLKQS